MNKQEFMHNLSRALHKLPEDERQDILYDYEEHFTLGIEAGKTEDKIAASLGDIRSIARHYQADYVVKQAEETKSITNLTRAAMAVISLGFFNLVFVLGPFVGLLGLLIGLYGASLAITVTGIASFLGAVLQPIFPGIADIAGNPLFFVFAGIGLTSLGILTVIGNVFLTKVIYRAAISYLRFNMKLIAK